MDMEFKLDRLRSAFPTRIRIEFSHLGRQRRRFLAKIFLVEDSVLVDHEAHYTGHSVAGRISDHCESPKQFAVCRIVVGPPGAF